MCSRGSLVTGSKPLSSGEAEHRFRLEIVRIRRHELAEAGDVGGIGGILRARRAARGHRFDVETLARRHRLAQRHRLADRFTRPNLRIESGTARRTGHGVRRRGRRGASATAGARGPGVAQQLERRAVIAGRAEGDAPVRHRHVRIELQRLRARPLGFHEPERMNLRNALQEELPRLLGRRRHRKILGDAHARAAVSPATAAGRRPASRTCPADAARAPACPLRRCPMKTRLRGREPSQESGVS